MGKSDQVADMSLEMCNDNGGQPYIYIVKNWREELEGRTGGKNWREKMAGRKMAGKMAALMIGVSVDIMSCGVYLVPDGVTNRD